MTDWPQGKKTNDEDGGELMMLMVLKETFFLKKTKPYIDTLRSRKNGGLKRVGV